MFEVSTGAVGFFQSLVIGFRNIGAVFGVMNWRIDFGAFSVGFLDLLLPASMLALVAFTLTLHIAHLVNPLG